MHWHHATGTLALDQPRLLAIVNVTPDSFSDGGQATTVERAVALARRLVEEGADVLDVGGESTRPNAAPVPLAEEVRRVVPTVEALRRELPEVPISVDTVKAGVARAALAAGASIINDVSAFRLDAEMAAACAAGGAGVVLMHSRGTVGDMASFEHAVYGPDLLADIVAELRVATDRARAAGLAANQVVVDPGLGFGKRTAHSVAILRGLDRLAALGYPVLVGASRKRFVGELSGVGEPRGRVAGTIAANVLALTRGARLFRVHDVAANREALATAWSILQHA